MEIQNATLQTCLKVSVTQNIRLTSNRLTIPSVLLQQGLFPYILSAIISKYQIRTINFFSGRITGKAAMNKLLKMVIMFDRHQQGSTYQQYFHNFNRHLIFTLFVGRLITRQIVRVRHFVFWILLNSVEIMTFLLLLKSRLTMFYMQVLTLHTRHIIQLM